MITISNSTPLISLSKIGLLYLLHSLFGTITIPQAVYDEVVVDGKDKAGAAEVTQANWIRVLAVKNQRTVQQLMKAARLHGGESEAIILAGELKATYLILDDLDARKVASQKTLPVLGTLGVLLAAKTKGFIPQVAKPLHALLAAGHSLDPETYRTLLQKAGEL